MCFPCHTEITTQTKEEKLFSPQWDLNHGPLELKASVLPIKLLRIPVNHPYRLERIVRIDLSTLDKNGLINSIYQTKIQ